MWDLTGVNIYPTASNFTVLHNNTELSTATVNVVENTDGTDYDIMINITSTLLDGDQISLKFNDGTGEHISPKSYIYDTQAPNFNVVQISTDNAANATWIEPGNTVALKVKMSEPIEIASATLEGVPMEISDQSSNNFTFLFTFHELPTEAHNNALGFALTLVDSAGNTALKGVTTDNSNVYFQVTTETTIENRLNEPTIDNYCSHQLDLTITGNVMDTAALAMSTGENVLIHWEKQYNDGEWEVIPNSNTMNYVLSAVTEDGNYAFKRVAVAGSTSYSSNEIDIDITDVDAITVTTFPNNTRFNVNSTTPVTLSTDIVDEGVTLTCSGNGISSNSFTPSVAGEGTHIITYTLNGGNCTKVVTKNFYVYTPETIVNLPTSICSQNPNFVITKSTSTAAFNDLILKKIVGDGITDADPLLLQPALLFDITNEAGSSRNLTWEAFFVDSDGTLVDSVDIPVQVHKNSKLKITVDGDYFNQDTLFKYTDDPQITLSGLLNDESFSAIRITKENETPQIGSLNFQPIIEGVGIYNINFYADDLNSCASSDNLVVKVLERQNNTSIVINAGDSIALKNILDQAQVSYSSTDPIAQWPRYIVNNDGYIIQLNLSNISTLNHLSDEVGKLKKLQVLKASNSNLLTVSDSIWGLRELWLLDLSFNLLENQDVMHISSLSNIRTLYLHHNRLTQLPDLSSLDSLRNIFASHNEINQIDGKIQGSNELRILDLSNNRIDTLGNVLSGKSLIDKLNFSHNNLKEWQYTLPSTVSELDISHNNINVINTINAAVNLNVSYNNLGFDQLTKLITSTTKALPQFVAKRKVYIDKQLGGDYQHNYQPISGESVEWVKDSITLGSQLNLLDITLSDGGKYSCYATHSDWVGIRLHIYDVHVGINCTQQDSIQINADRHTWFCNNEPISIQLSSNPIDENLSYQWFLNDTLISDATNAILTTFKEGSYTVNAISAEGCISYSNALTIERNRSDYHPTIAYENKVLSVGNTEDNKQYSWFFGDDLIADQITSITPNRLGQYTVRATDSLGCYTISDTMNVQDEEWITDIASFTMADDLKVFPNPSNGETIQVKSTYLMSTIKMYTMTGELILIKSGINSKFTKLNQKQHGIYLMKIYGKNLEYNHRKVIIGKSDR
ncbi:leucine-rich repeat domain-containing protein [Flammeovirga pacifica]|uniref:Ig-like domain-containing protein n=1 Tax=Flammeovirga pacifica TaxID=915059 RepID=A0A1S1YSL9_FLAPC|nr:T9SS type A sorting domain-containing protein [Flammeovirga pacifica]OHX64019.1 hypothetical protein NH26_20640 [Flammeovirga pacifica]